jgi:hypothetical protein
MRALLDVNVLVALLDADHIFHARATAWLEAHRGSGWASCPLTENGCVRVMSRPAYSNPLPAPAVIARLAQAAAHPGHEFWSADISLLEEDRIASQRLLSGLQVADVYLLALAVRRNGRFVTFDGRIPLEAVRGAQPHHLVVL